MVKPFGPTWNSCMGVTFHDRADLPGVIHAVLDLLTLIEPGTGIVVQSFHPTFDPVVLPDAGRHAINVEGESAGVTAVHAGGSALGDRVTRAVLCWVTGLSEPAVPWCQVIRAVLSWVTGLSEPSCPG